MGIFGWSYPPGCSSVPGDEPFQCEVCGMVDDCCCPECPICGERGNPECYMKPYWRKDHGMEMNEEQIAAKEKANKRAREEDAMWDARAQIYEEEQIDAGVQADESKIERGQATWSETGRTRK